MIHLRLPRRLAALAAALALLWLAPAQANAPVSQSYGGRDLFVYVPDHLPPAGARALVIVLHGGLGNAGRIVEQRSESGLNLDDAADKHGFIVAYLNGTAIARLFSERMKGWNAGGGCCGLPAKQDVDDVAYITGAVDDLAAEYGIDRRQVYGIGHSNGAMMAMRMVCETDVFAAVVSISGPLNLDTASCPAARGKRVLAIHGAGDENVPIAGGRGSKGLSGVDFSSEARSQQIFTASGASYDLDIVPGADHMLDHLETAIEQRDGVTIAEKAVRFFGMAGHGP